MGYKRVTIVDAWEIIRRWHSGQSKRRIAQALGYDRKTVRKYIRRAQEAGLSREEPLPAKDTVTAMTGGIVSEIHRPAKAQEVLTPYLEEIVGLVTDPDNPLVPKNAFDVVCKKHDLEGEVSYGSFKRFARRHRLLLYPHRSTCRIEVDPGEELQIDYGKMGLLMDPLLGRRRVVYAFIGTLSHSRHKYVEFTWSQGQREFVGSHIRMFEYFGGVVSRIAVDNLKSGVLKPDLYDPRLNRSYQEMAEHYGCFIDPCRIRHAKDKGKVERDVQTVRQMYRKLLALNPTMIIQDANGMARRWCIDEYGQRAHGTTGLPPYPTFLEKEKPALKPLPEDPFEIAIWKEVGVHPDHYIQFDKKFYSIPDEYCEKKKVWVKATEKILSVYFQEKLIKQHVITSAFRHTDPTDFPPNMQAVLDGGIPAKLQKEALQVGPSFGKLVRNVLEPHAFLNMRKAQGLVRLAGKYRSELVEEAARAALVHRLSPAPKFFRRLLEKIEEYHADMDQLPLSPESREFLRDLAYFTYPSPQETGERI